MDEYHLEVVRERSKHGSMGFEVNISNSYRAVTQEAELSLHVQLLEKDKAVAGSVHGGSEQRDNMNM